MRGGRFPHGARALPHVSRRYSSPLIVSNNARVPGQRCLCQCLSRCRVLKYLDFNEIYIPEAVSRCALLWGPWGEWGWRVGDRVPWVQPFPPWMPSAGTEQPGWVLGNAPLPHLDLQNQPELMQRMGGRGLSLLGETAVPKGKGGSKCPRHSEGGLAPRMPWASCPSWGWAPWRAGAPQCRPRAGRAGGCSMGDGGGTSASQPPAGGDRQGWPPRPHPTGC